MIISTFVIILNSKLDKWEGSNLWRTPLAADSCTDEDGFLASKRFSKDSIACDSWFKGDADEDRGIKRSETRIKNFKYHKYEFMFGM